MAPLEPWEKVLVDMPAFGESEHGQMDCIYCHSGDSAQEEKEAAHTDMISRPSEDAEAFCSACHAETVETYPTSLHVTQEGYWTALDARSAPENHDELSVMFGNHCASCHTSCGDCHISQPATVGGGFIDGHLFQETPSITRNCTACHGSRVGNEYLGKHEGLNADVHFRQARMGCADCHTGDSMHGSRETCSKCHEEAEDLGPVPDRYHGQQDPSCESCHAEVGVSDDQMMHTQHAGDLQCQVCHSVSYSSCDSCHVALSEETGKPYFSTEGSYLTFLIGKNPDQTEARPYQFTLVRHIPVDPDAYDYYGENLLTNFNALPTWAMTTPHNIQLQTPQNASCNACHDHAELFLTADKIAPEELEANMGIYFEMDEIPSFGSD